jgi:hypothetical protein
MTTQTAAMFAVALALLPDPVCPIDMRCLPVGLAVNESDAEFPKSKRETCWRTNRFTGQKFRIC